MLVSHSQPANTGSPALLLLLLLACSQPLPRLIAACHWYCVSSFEQARTGKAQITQIYHKKKTTTMYLFKAALLLKRSAAAAPITSGCQTQRHANKTWFCLIKRTIFFPPLRLSLSLPFSLLSDRVLPFTLFCVGATSHRITRVRK